MKTLIIAISLLSLLCSCGKQQNEESADITHLNMPSPEIKHDPPLIELNMVIDDNGRMEQKAGGNLNSINTFFATVKKIPQQFLLDADTGGVIVCSEKTKITIPSGAFTLEETGEMISGPIHFSVTEYYQVKDILFAQLTTESAGGLLESGGMIRIDANYNGQPCALSKEIEIEFANRKEGMEIFYAEKSDDDRITWYPATRETEPDMIVNNNERSNTLICFAEPMPEFPGGTNAMINWIRSNLKYPTIAKEINVEGTVYVRFTVQGNGTVINPVIVRGVGYGCDEEVLRIIRIMPKWIGGKQNGEPVDVVMTLPVKFDLEDDYGMVERDFSLADTAKLRGYSDEIITSGASNAVLKSSRIGFINCDRFVKSGLPKTNFVVSCGDEKDIRVNLIFKNINAVMGGISSSQGFEFAGVDKGEPVYVFALKYHDGKLYYHLSETTTSNQIFTELNFEETTTEVLITELSGLQPGGLSIK